MGHILLSRMSPFAVWWGGSGAEVGGWDQVASLAHMQVVHLHESPTFFFLLLFYSRQEVLQLSSTKKKKNKTKQNNKPEYKVKPLLSYASAED